MLENPILIHAQRFKRAAFGDKRLQKRGLHYTRQFVNISPSTFGTLARTGLSKWDTTVF